MLQNSGEMYPPDRVETPRVGKGRLKTRVLLKEQKTIFIPLSETHPCRCRRNYPDIPNPTSSSFLLHKMPAMAKDSQNSKGDTVTFCDPLEKIDMED
jgi:hypothetical protein